MRLPRLIRCVCGEVCWRHHGLCRLCRVERDRWIANAQWIEHVQRLDREWEDR